jgi:hypothetical protein
MLCLHHLTKDGEYTLSSGREFGSPAGELACMHGCMHCASCSIQPATPPAPSPTWLPPRQDGRLKVAAELGGGAQHPGVAEAHHGCSAGGARKERGEQSSVTVQYKQRTAHMGAAEADQGCAHGRKCNGTGGERVDGVSAEMQHTGGKSYNYRMQHLGVTKSNCHTTEPRTLFCPPHPP